MMFSSFVRSAEPHEPSGFWSLSRNPTPRSMAAAITESATVSVGPGCSRGEADGAGSCASAPAPPAPNTETATTARHANNAYVRRYITGPQGSSSAVTAYCLLPTASRLARQDLIPRMQPLQDHGLAPGALSGLDDPLLGLAGFRGQIDDASHRPILGLVLEHGRGRDGEGIRGAIGRELEIAGHAWLDQ